MSPPPHSPKRTGCTWSVPVRMMYVGASSVCVLRDETQVETGATRSCMPPLLDQHQAIRLQRAHPPARLASAAAAKHAVSYAYAGAA